MKLEVGKTYLRYDDTIVHVVGRMEDGVLFGWHRHLGENRKCTPSIYPDEMSNCSEYTPPKTVTTFLNVYPNADPEMRAYHHESMEDAMDGRDADGVTLEVTYCEDGTATVKVHQP